MSRPITYNGAQNFLYEDERAFFSVYKMDRTGALNFGESVAQFDNMLLQEVNDVDQERVQIILSDSPKLYAFGKQHRFIQCAAIILDNFQNIIQAGGDSWDGSGYRNWKRFYEEFGKLSTCAKKSHRVSLQTTRRVYVGGLTEASISHSASNPNQYDLNFVFYTTDVISHGR